MIEQLIVKLTNKAKRIKYFEEVLTQKDQELSELKIDFLEVSQHLEEYKLELSKVGDVEKIKQRLENEKMARRQLVKEKVGFWTFLLSFRIF